MELYQQVDDKGPVTIPDTPDEIIFTLPEIISHITSITPLQCQKVTGRGKFGMKETTDEICHHLFVAEEAFIRVI